jgi:uncharacterized protein (TIGR00255 family)
MKSMTGYGAAQVTQSDYEISIVIKSVNGRFFEPRFHLAKELFFLENPLKTELQKVLRRGTVDIFVYKREVAKSSLSFNFEASIKLKNNLKLLAQKTGLKVSDDRIFEKLVTHAQLIDGPAPHKNQKDDINKVKKTFLKALEDLDKERMREGRALGVSIKDLLRRLKKCVLDIENLRKESQRELEDRMHQRLEKLGLATKVDPARFAQELIIYIDKSDISEEITRLGEHLSMFQKEVDSPGVQGKKLDFYCQELLRETNTIGSKANLARLTERVVEAKGLIESLKEQIQNVE